MAQYRVLLLAALLAGLLLSVFAVAVETVYADTSVTITITATGIVVGAPAGFTVWYVTDHEVGMSWTKPAGSVNTMVRAEYGQYPDEPALGAQPTDGYLVYYGPAITASDTSVSLDETGTAVYYRAWSENGAGIWSSTFGEDSQEGIGMTLIALVLLALGLTVAMFVTRNLLLGFPCVMFWGVLAGYAYNQSTVTWDWQYLLFFSSAGMAIFSSIAMYALRHKDLGEPDADKGQYFDEGQQLRPFQHTSSRDLGPEDRDYSEDDEPRESRRSRELHRRAELRRTGPVRRKNGWGEFK